MRRQIRLGILGGADDAASGGDTSAGVEAAGEEKINVTFGKDGPLGIVFTDEGWEIEDIAEGSAAAEMETLHPGLCLVEIQGVDIVTKSDDEIREMFGHCGRPVRLTFLRDNPRYADGPKEGADDKASAAPVPDVGADGTVAAGEDGNAGQVAPPPPPRGQGRAGVEPAWKSRQKQKDRDVVASADGKRKPEASQAGADVADQGSGESTAAGEGFTYNWKTGLYHNAKTGYSYDQQTGYYSTSPLFAPDALVSHE